MPIKRHWTAPEDAQIRRLRAQGNPWGHIAAALHVSRNATIARGHTIGATAPLRTRYSDPLLDYLADRTREPLPPGHCVTWHAITVGTLLDDCPYPPVPAPVDESA